jgi:hypothetical protein
VQYKFEAIVEFHSRMENRSIADSQFGAQNSLLSSRRRICAAIIEEQLASPCV